MDLDHFSYLIDRQDRYVLIGVVFLVMTAVFTVSGEALERYGGIVYRTEEPKRFWWDVVLCFLAGLSRRPFLHWSLLVPEFKLRHYRAMADPHPEWENYKRRRNLKLFLLIGYIPITFAFGLITTRLFHTAALVGVFAILWMSLSLYVATHNNVRCPRCGKLFCFDRD